MLQMCLQADVYCICVAALSCRNDRSKTPRSVIIKVIFNLCSQYISNIYIHSEAQLLPAQDFSTGTEDTIYSHSHNRI